jgi:hypothetical protein
MVTLATGSFVTVADRVRLRVGLTPDALIAASLA